MGWICCILSDALADQLGDHFLLFNQGGDLEVDLFTIGESLLDYDSVLEQSIPVFDEGIESVEEGVFLRMNME